MGTIAMTNVLRGLLIFAGAVVLAECTRHGGNTVPAVVATATPVPQYQFIINNQTGIRLDITTTLGKSVLKPPPASQTLAPGKNAIFMLNPKTIAPGALAKIEMIDNTKTRSAVNQLSISSTLDLQIQKTQLTQLFEVASTVVSGADQTIIATMYCRPYQPC
jgi:hypothetical protein